MQTQKIAVAALGLLAGCDLGKTAGPAGQGAPVPHVASGNGFSCALASQSVHCWGVNSSGQLGRDAGAGGGPAPVAGDHRFRRLAAGDRNACGLADDAIVCWGHGALFGSTAPVLTPTAISAPQLAFVGLGVGFAHACALTEDGAIWCWGENSNGELGNGSAVDSPAATLVAGDHQFSAMDVGSFHGCGLAGGEVWCWGFNFGLALGAGTTVNGAYVLPVRVTLPFVASAIEAGAAVTCALDAAPRPWCWGTNFAGQLGRGGSGASSGDPVAVAIDAPVTALAATSLNSFVTHTCALLSAGEAWCWGAAAEGRLGRAPTETCGTGTLVVACAPLPAPVDAALAFRAIAPGADHTCGLTTGDRVFCWGNNDRGQLGVAAASPGPTPVLVPIGG